MASRCSPSGKDAGGVGIRQSARRDSDDQVVRGIFRSIDGVPIEAVEHDDSYPSQAFVAVDQGMVACQGFQQYGCLLVIRGICILAEQARRGAIGRRFQQAEITDRTDPEHIDDCEQIVQDEKDRH